MTDDISRASAIRSYALATQFCLIELTYEYHGLRPLDKVSFESKRVYLRENRHLLKSIGESHKDEVECFYNLLLSEDVLTNKEIVLEKGHKVLDILQVYIQ